MDTITRLNQYIAHSTLQKVSDFCLVLGDCSEYPTLECTESELFKVTIIVMDNPEESARANIEVIFDDDWVDCNPDVYQDILNNAHSVDPVGEDNHVIMQYQLHELPFVLNRYFGA